MYIFIPLDYNIYIGPIRTISLNAYFCRKTSSDFKNNLTYSVAFKVKKNIEFTQSQFYNKY